MEENNVIRYEDISGCNPTIAVFDDEEWIYYMSEGTSGIFRHREGNDLDEVFAIYDQRVCPDGFYSMIRFENDLWLAPRGKSEIVRVSLVDRKVFYYNVPYWKNQKTYSILPFCNMYIINGELYLIPFEKNISLIKIDLYNYKIENIKKFSVFLENRKEIRLAGCIKNNTYIYIFDSAKNSVIIYDTEKDDVREMLLNNNCLQGYHLMRCEGGAIFYPDDVINKTNDDYYYVDMRDFSLREFRCKYDFRSDEIKIHCGNNILLNKDSKILSFNKEWSEYKETKIENMPTQHYKYSNGTYTNNKCYITGHKAVPMICIDGENISIINTKKQESYLAKWINWIVDCC